MIKIEALTLEEAYSNAASQLDCSVTELVVEVVQYPSSGILGLFRKKAIIVATREKKQADSSTKEDASTKLENIEDTTDTYVKEAPQNQEAQTDRDGADDAQTNKLETESVQSLSEVEKETALAIDEVVAEVAKELPSLFEKICFELDEISVEAYDENTIYVEINGADAALLIGKEGYRYKALSYMIFNWINAKYGVQLRLEIAEFLKNQEEAVHRYLESVKESIDRDGRAQTKILDGVLVQIALRELRATYPEKYVAIRTTRDGLKYIIVNDYNY